MSQIDVLVNIRLIYLAMALDMGRCLVYDFHTNHWFSSFLAL